MSYSLDCDVQEDLHTFPMYQRFRKINPYAYYSLNTQKQMQSDLRNFGSFTFFEQDPDNVPEADEPTSSIDLPKALAEAEHWLATASPEFNDKTETALVLLHATYRDLEKLSSEFDMYEDGSTPVIHYNLYDEWFAAVGCIKTHAVNMKCIQQHGSKYRV